MKAAILATTMLALGTPAFGGAWPRGESEGFLSLKYTGRWDTDRIALLDFRREDHFQGYGEFGVTSRLTFGGEYAVSGPENAPVTEVRGFLRYTFLQRGAHVMSAELGAGRRGNDFEYSVGYIRPGIAWGTGLDNRFFGNGWLEVDAQAEIYTDSENGDSALKLDSTIALNLHERLSVMLQARAGDYPGIDPFIRLAPSAVVRVTDRLRVQGELEGGVYNDTGISAAVALWIDF